MNLTPKQKAFCDYYLETGNATEAARRAGYKCPDPQGRENLRKPTVIDYIKERQKQIEDARIADVKEVMQFFTSVMRGEVADQFGLEAELQTRMNAAKEIMRRKERIEDLEKRRKKEDLEIEKLNNEIEKLKRQNNDVYDEDDGVNLIFD